jgi:hypothetical protein
LSTPKTKSFEWDKALAVGESTAVGWSPIFNSYQIETASLLQPIGDCYQHWKVVAGDIRR